MAAVTVRRHDSADGRWELVETMPHPALRGLVTRYSSYSEDFPGPLRRRQVPSPGLPLIVSFGDPLRIVTMPDSTSGPVVESFVAGLHDGPAVTEHAGRQQGVGVRLTPLGAYRLLGMPLYLLTNAVIEVPTLLGGAGTELVERLAEARGCRQRFAALDDVLAARLQDAPAPSPAIAWAWRRLCATAGRVTVAELTARVGWSHRHFVARCREQIGLAPKAATRLLRFHHAVRLLGQPHRSLAEVATLAGYSDQAHFGRDFHTFAGCAPTAYRVAQRVDGAGTSG